MNEKKNRNSNPVRGLLNADVSWTAAIVGHEPWLKMAAA